MDFDECISPVDSEEECSMCQEECQKSELTEPTTPTPLQALQKTFSLPVARGYHVGSMRALEQREKEASPGGLPIVNNLNRFSADGPSSFGETKELGGFCRISQAFL